MSVIIRRPSKRERLLYQAIERELNKRAGDSLSDTERHIIVANFISNYDFTNPALSHKSAGGWADMILSELSST